MVGMTRAHMADPHLVRKIELGRRAQIRPCVGATYCLDRIYQAGEALCIHNAATGRELTMPHVIEPAPPPRRVVVVGAGAGGLGGGAGSCASAGTTSCCSRRCRGRVVRSAWRRATRAGKDLHGHRRMARQRAARGSASTCATTRTPTQHSVPSLHPDVVIVATGGLPQLPELEAGADLVVTSWDVVGGDVQPHRRRAAVRRRRHALGDDDGRDDRPVGRHAGDRHARADVGRRRRRA